MSIIKVLYVKIQEYAYSDVHFGSVGILTGKNENKNFSNSISLFYLVIFAQQNTINSEYHHMRQQISL